MYLKGHYYSPYPDMNYIEKNYSDDIIEYSIDALNLKEDDIINQLVKLSKYRRFIDFNKSQYFNPNNLYFRYTDAWVYATMIHYLKPQTIVEIGSGFSTAIAIDMNTEYFNESINILSIDPDQKRINEIIGNRNPKILLKPLSLLEIDIESFSQLNKNDILFIDSSHMLKQGSDVNYILFNILPMLNSDVVVHFHDIFLFNYPKAWFKDGRAWNESYAIRAFLSYNSRFQILFLNKWVTTQLEEICMKEFPELLIGHGGSSLYIRKK